jgi:alpha-D-xyloside xylohydrolase
LDEDEVIYGLGQHQGGLMNQRNQRVHLEQDNMQISIPYFASVKGYGLYWDNYSITTFDDSPMGTSFRSEAGEAVDYYFLYGKDGDGTVSLLRQLSGQAPMVPLWTLGFWQCKERYKSKEEIVEVAQKYRNLGVPLDAVVQDWKYWGEENENWNALQFLNSEFSNPDWMFENLKKLKVNMMITIWPSVGINTDIYKDLAAMGAIYPMQSSPKEAKVYDIFNEKARKVFWDYMNKNMFQKGMSAWWMDGSEPEFYNTTQGDFNLQTAEGPLRNIRNTYPLFVSKGIYDNQRATTSDKRVYILTRSGYTGLQRYGAGSWSGDIRASWEVFRKQIPAGLNYSICGIPYWNTDIGAWHPFERVYRTAHQDPAYQQIYCRWFQFATFNPMMRSHGTGSPREIYQFGKRGYWAFDVQEKFLNLRYQMLPYLYSTAWQVTSKGYSYLRQLSMEAPKDKNTYDISDEFMFGKAFLVAPVLEENATSREVYLPDNGKWIDFWNNKVYEGGQTVKRDTPIDIIPVFVKAGSILPLTTQKVQYANEKKWNKLEIRVYPGADGDFILYEDENDNYNYEKGAYTEIPMHWDNASGTLTISARKGDFNGMLKSRSFVVNVAGKKGSKTVSYNGSEVKIKI